MIEVQKAKVFRILGGINIGILIQDPVPRKIRSEFKHKIDPDPT